jgi:hypothetical protein
LNKLEELAKALAAGADAPELRADFHHGLRFMTDKRFLKDLAEKFTPYVEVSVPVYERILELDPQDADAMVNLGFVFFLDGEDENARVQVEAATRVDPEHVGAMGLEAALSRDRTTKIHLYQKMLAKDPANQVAIANLKELGALGDRESGT